MEVERVCRIENGRCLFMDLFASFQEPDSRYIWLRPKISFKDENSTVYVVANLWRQVQKAGCTIICTGAYGHGPFNFGSFRYAWFWITHICSLDKLSSWRETRNCWRDVRICSRIIVRSSLGKQNGQTKQPPWNNRRRGICHFCDCMEGKVAGLHNVVELCWRCYSSAWGGLFHKSDRRWTVGTCTTCTGGPTAPY